MPQMTHIPSIGLDRQSLFATLATIRGRDVNWRAGRVMAGVYDPGDAVADTIKTAYSDFLTENALYPNFFPSLVKLETDVVRMLANLLRGGPGVVGNCTSGGTESIMLAVKAARDQARSERGIHAPEIVVPITAHAAFHKAAHYLGCKIVSTPVDPLTFRADVEAMRAAITLNTVMLVGSAPCYSHGVIDPIPQIAALAQSRGLLCHVDACVGGIHLAIMRTLRERAEIAHQPLAGGRFLPHDFDFKVPGVTSISTDMHKYGYAAKNVSVILYRDAALRRHAMWACADTTGYAVLNPTVLSSKSGGPIAGAWAALMSLGEAGYQAIVSEVQDAVDKMIAGISSIPGLRVLGDPDMCMFAMASDDLNVFELDDAMAKRGWMLQPQFSTAGHPANLHVSVHRGNVPHVDTFLADLRAATAECRAAYSPSAGDALRAQVLAALSGPLTPETFARLMQLGGLQPGLLPDGFARVNTVLDALPDGLVNVLLVEYMNALYV